MLSAIDRQPVLSNRQPTLRERLERPMPMSDTLVLSDRCMAAGPTTPLPNGTKVTFKGRKPKLTRQERADIASIEGFQRKLLVDAIKADPSIMAALGAWRAQSEAQKLDILRRIAALEGQAFHFTPAPMTLDRKAKKGDYGAYDDDARKIELGAWGFRDANPRDLVDTVIHEQLHALQHQRYVAMRAGGINPRNPQHAQAREWLYNNDHYHEFDKGPAAYRHQPLEAHAWDGAGAVMDELFGPKK